MTPDPKLGTQGSWVRDPKNQVLFLPKPYRVGCPSIANRGTLNPILKPVSLFLMTHGTKLGTQVGSWVQEAPAAAGTKFGFCRNPISCWVSFHSKSGSAESDFEISFLYRWPLTKLGTQGSWVRDLRPKQFSFWQIISCRACPLRVNRGRWIRFWNQFSYSEWPLTQNL